ncbi:MAG TPA: hypothetical protein VHC23_12655, partial [Jatrophihabitans sp.]|nr:hypothetical protein [Jatrophihabitans sp.]
QARAQSGDPGTALRLLEPLTEVVDAGGRRLDPGVLVEFRALTRVLLGDAAGAVADLAAAMSRYGRIAGLADLARGSFGPAGVPALVAAVQRTGGPHADQAVAALLG